MSVLAGPKAIVNVDHGHAGSAGVEHSQQRSQTVEAGPVTDAGRYADDRAGGQAADHAGQSAFHAGHTDDDAGLKNPLALVEQAMDAGHAHIVSPLHPAAQKFDHLTHLEFLNRRLSVMDSTAVTLCMENNLPILVLNLWDTQALLRALAGEQEGTLVSA